MRACDAPHGTPTRYNFGCRCGPCGLAASEHRMRSAREGLAEKNRVRDYRHVIAHLEELRRLGVNDAQIARSARVSTSTIYYISKQRWEWISKDREQRLLAVTPVTAYPRKSTPAIGSLRRLRAMSVLGWSLEAIAAEVGFPRDSLQEIRNGEREWVWTTTHDRIKAWFDANQLRTGDSPITAARSIAKGWAPPLAWDEEDIDRADAVPQGKSLARKGDR